MLIEVELYSVLPGLIEWLTVKVFKNLVLAAGLSTVVRDSLGTLSTETKIKLLILGKYFFISDMI